MLVYLVPLGRRTFDLYSEAQDAPSAHDAAGHGFFRRTMARARAGWHDLVAGAHRRQGGGRWTRLQDRLVRHLAEAMSEQRTLWHLRDLHEATLVHGTDMAAAQARALLDGHLATARRHHRLWLVVDGLLFGLSGLLVLVPGPNVIAYYFAFRLVGHFLSWRGAVRGADRIAWSLRAEPALADLAVLAGLPRDERAARVDAIAAALNLPKLAAFFDRAALPGG